MSINKQLDHMLSKHIHVDAKLQQMSKVLPKVEIIKAEADKFAGMIVYTNQLAEKVSAKVRYLDLARVS